MIVKVKKLFADTKEGVDRLPGDEFKCTKERGEEILAKLGGDFVELVNEPRAKKAVKE